MYAVVKAADPEQRAGYDTSSPRAIFIRHSPHTQRLAATGSGSERLSCLNTKQISFDHQLAKLFKGSLRLPAQ